VEVAISAARARRAELDARLIATPDDGPTMVVA
jgi:hypothetical protein